MKKNKHPYYDSDKKKQTEEFAIKIVGYSVVAIIILMILASI